MHEIVQNELTFLKKTVSHKVISNETLHPWRSQGEFLLHHSLRVEAYARRIWHAEHGGNRDEEQLLRIVVLLHDIGRLDGHDNHAVRSAALAETWLRTQSMSGRDQERIIHLIADHSNKGHSNGDALSDIFKDADILDEIGVMSVFMAGNWIDRNDPGFFLLLSEKLKQREIPFCEEQMRLLTTETAKAMLRRKRTCIERVIEELDFELSGTV